MEARVHALVGREPGHRRRHTAVRHRAERLRARPAACAGAAVGRAVVEGQRRGHAADEVRRERQRPRRRRGRAHVGVERRRRKARDAAPPRELRLVACLEPVRRARPALEAELVDVAAEALEVRRPGRPADGDVVACSEVHHGDGRVRPGLLAIAVALYRGAVARVGVVVPLHVGDVDARTFREAVLPELEQVAVAVVPGQHPPLRHARAGLSQLDAHPGVGRAVHRPEAPGRAVRAGARDAPVVPRPTVEVAAEGRRVEAVAPHGEVVDVQELPVRPDVRVHRPRVRRPVALGDGGPVHRPRRRGRLHADRSAGPELRHQHPERRRGAAFGRRELHLVLELSPAVGRVEVEPPHVAHRGLHAVGQPGQAVVERHHQREVEEGLRAGVLGEGHLVDAVVVVHLRRGERQRLDPRRGAADGLEAHLVERRAGQVLAAGPTANRYPLLNRTVVV